MRAVVITEPGDADVLAVQDVPEPVPGPEEVLIAIRATALNRADLLQRRGFYPEPGPPREHEVPGMELAGTVVALGERATAWQVGDEVMGIVSGGAYAERITVHERQLMAIPPALGLADAAAVPEVAITAWDALVVRGGLTSGRAALIHAGASGVGSAGIPIAKALGATVVTTTSTAKVEACKGFGADVVVDYTTEDYVEAVWAATDGRGVDVVLDVVGGDYLMRNVKALRTGGTIVQVGVMGGGRTDIDLGALLPKRATLRGTVLRSRPLDEKIAVTQRFAREVLPWHASGAIRPVIDSRYPLDAIADAHRHMETNANVGKILIDIGD
jgi:NADPH:quinone reductase